MKIHYPYRDFFLFLRAIEIEANQWHSFKEYYFNKYKDFLSEVWFNLQGYSQQNIKERVAVIKKEDYSDLEAGLRLYDIENNTRQIINDCRTVLYYPEICNIYLYIGFFSPDAFVFKFKDEFVIAVGLERFHDFNYYPILLAHEYSHYIQNMVLGEQEGDLIDKILREGISVYFSKSVYPGKKPWKYLFMTRSNYDQLEKNYDSYIETLKKKNFEYIDIFHGISDGLYDFYPRAGYFIGFKMVNDFIDKNFHEKIDFIKLFKERFEILNYFIYKK